MWEVVVKTPLGEQIEQIDFEISELMFEVEALRTQKDELVAEFQNQCEHKILEHKEGGKSNAWSSYMQGWYKCINCGLRCDEFEKGNVFGYDSKITRVTE